MVSVCLPSDALLQHLLSYLGFSYLGREVSLHGCFSKVQPLLLTLDDGYVLTASMVRSYPTSEVSGGSEETPHIRGQGQQLRGAALRTRSVAAGKRNLMPEAWGGDPEEPLRA